MLLTKHDQFYNNKNLEMSNNVFISINYADPQFSLVRV